MDITTPVTVPRRKAPISPPPAPTQRQIIYPTITTLTDTAIRQEPPAAKAGEIITPTIPYFGQEYRVIKQGSMVRGLYVSDQPFLCTFVGLGMDRFMIGTDSKSYSRCYRVEFETSKLEQVADYTSSHFDFYVLDVQRALMKDVVDELLPGATQSSTIISFIAEKDFIQRLAAYYPQKSLTFSQGSRHGDVIDPNVSEYFRVA